jgi:hypothetical protein
MTVVLAQPWLLALLLVAVPIILLVPRQRLKGASFAMRTAVLATRLLVVALTLAALAEPSLKPPGQSRAVVFALDVSNSLSPEQKTWSRAWMQRAARTLPDGSQWQSIEFGDQARLGGQSNDPPPDGATTDLANALAMAGALVRHDA